MSSLNIFVTTWNTGLQGSQAQHQDLSSWLLPVLHNATNPELPVGIVPDIYAVGVQELVPMHLALAGLTGPVLYALTQRIQSILSDHATSLSSEKTSERYSLVARVAHVGNALWVFSRDKTLEGRLGKPSTAKTGLAWFGMGNKGAVGIRLPIRRGSVGGWENLTFVNTHLAAHDFNIARRNAQYRDILSSLVFDINDPLTTPQQIFDTSHLFFIGDLNYRLSKQPPLEALRENNMSDDALSVEKARMIMFEDDTLREQQKQGNVFGGLREGDVTRFAPTYKRIVGKIEGYSEKRVPGWTDRILLASHTDPPYLFSTQTLSNPVPPDEPTTTCILRFDSTPGIVISDHKPVHALFSLPAVKHEAPSAHMAPILPPAPVPHSPRPFAKQREMLIIRRIIGTLMDKIIGWPWCFFVLLGRGNSQAGMGVSAFLAMVWGVWWSGVMNG
ncbi:hypothetical protein L204_103982 [Cryptococcus depauperatus]|nr:hypothetical protein L204_03136 [Cryptococcus depauperatus CBS 7855]